MVDNASTDDTAPSPRGARVVHERAGQGEALRAGVAATPDAGSRVPDADLSACGPSTSTTS